MMTFSILKDKESDKYSLTRTISAIVTTILSFGFLLLCYKGRTSWEVFIAYPFGVAVAQSPQLFLRMLNDMKSFIKVWKGAE